MFLFFALSFLPSDLQLTQSCIYLCEYWSVGDCRENMTLATGRSWQRTSEPAKPKTLLLSVVGFVFFGSPYLLHGSHITRKAIWFSQVFVGAVQREFLRSCWGGEKRVTLIASPDILSLLCVYCPAFPSLAEDCLF